ncbi:hypothetical protein AGABI2DRAFT_178861, partial [Agaricus bisporus var. bisporus H97]|uniref:hypothetical protein n=1 Tax=Agaricus bisporus var. bisporus (strain H97 / ATCC MYA-4626 / FGSC 10389) TaxID=936046 RepID=UPI00029F50BE
MVFWVTFLPFFTVSVRGALSYLLKETVWNSFDHHARDVLALATPSLPQFVIYNDAYDGNVDAQCFKDKGKAYDWTTLTNPQRSNTKSQYTAAGIKLIASAFGSTDVPTTINADPVAAANTFAAWVEQYGLDGIDVDYEDFIAFKIGNENAEYWLIIFTKQLRKQLHQGSYVLIHARMSMYLLPEQELTSMLFSRYTMVVDMQFDSILTACFNRFSRNRWSGGGYLKVHQGVGNLIDWYNVQFYNQDPGVNEYTACNNLLTASSSTWPKTSVFEIAASVVPLSKIVIGKPATASDAGSGFISTSVLRAAGKKPRMERWYYDLAVPPSRLSLDYFC